MTKTQVFAQYVSVAESDPATADRFYAVYEGESGYVWKTLGRLGVDAGDLADAVHDVFVIVHRRWSDFDPARPIRPWLFGIARRVAAGHRRKRRELPTQDVDHVVPASANEERDLLWRVLRELSDERVEVLVLHDIEGYTGAEIAAMLEMSPNTVHSRLRLAREDMRVALRRLRGDP